MKRKRLIMRTLILTAIAVAVALTLYFNYFKDHSVAQAWKRDD
ncbi:hypothetical protein [Alkalicoccobacillus plakortidis]|nr:hypothetical protein [Alkalicoccobacillus plakortidis]